MAGITDAALSETLSEFRDPEFLPTSGHPKLDNTSPKGAKTWQKLENSICYYLISGGQAKRQYSNHFHPTPRLFIGMFLPGADRVRETQLEEYHQVGGIDLDTIYQKCEVQVAQENTS